MLRFESILVGEGSPLGCTRCAAGAPPHYHNAAVIAERVRGTAATWSWGPGPNIALVGPDPFGHPELPALVAACVESGAQRIALETDGGALGAYHNAEGVLRAGVTHLWLRVLADGTLGDELTGRGGLTASAEVGVRAYLDAAEREGIPVVVTAIVPVCRHNSQGLSATVAALAAWGVCAVRLVAGGGSSPHPALAASVVAAACDTGMVNRLWVETDGSLPLPDSHRSHAVPDGGSRG